MWLSESRFIYIYGHSHSALARIVLHLSCVNQNYQTRKRFHIDDFQHFIGPLDDCSRCFHSSISNVSNLIKIQIKYFRALRVIKKEGDDASEQGMFTGFI